mmetsp:Transcript_24538/g.33662  ORF Transcript_24538/g.33662 Transcript_24538/m.33662 type:complete len:375 (-) Transcript_24538:23-1147(-)
MSLNRASRLLAEGQHAAALFEYSQLASSGIEPAQFNAAFLLSQQSCPPLAVVSGDRQEHQLLAQPTHEGEKVVLSKNFSTPNPLMSNKAAYLSLSATSGYPRNEVEPCEVRALLLFGLSAAQNNVEALLSLGDFHYYGRAILPANKAEAALYYKKAADLRHSAHAVFNLGLMHETGDGVPQDFLLAKRFYDQAAEMDSKAKIARDVAVSILEIHKSVHTALGREMVDRGMSALRLFTHEGLSTSGSYLFSPIQLTQLWTRFIEQLAATASSVLSIYRRGDNSHEDLEQLIILADETTTAVLDTLAELAGSVDPKLGIAIQTSRWAIERRCRRLTRLLLGLRRELACLGLLCCCFGLLGFMYSSRRRRRIGNGQR